MSSENKYSGLTTKIVIMLNLNKMLKHFYNVLRLHLKKIWFLTFSEMHQVKTKIYFLLLLEIPPCHKVTK